MTLRECQACGWLVDVAELVVGADDTIRCADCDVIHRLDQRMEVSA